MKKDKTITIKDPKLRFIRNNLRKLLYEACYDRQMKILDSIERFKHIMEYRDGKKPTPEEDEQAQKLSNERGRLENALECSIIYCQECKRTDKDMRYFIKWAEWVCVDCFNMVVKRWEYVEKSSKESEKHRW